MEKQLQMKRWNRQCKWWKISCQVLKSALSTRVHWSSCLCEVRQRVERFQGEGACCLKQCHCLKRLEFCWTWYRVSPSQDTHRGIALKGCGQSNTHKDYSTKVFVTRWWARHSILFPWPTVRQMLSRVFNASVLKFEMLLPTRLS